MDLLVVPSSPTLPVRKAPYVCTEHWDGGKYLDYAARKGRMSTVSPSLRGFVTAGATQTDAEYLEPIHPTPQAQQQSFFQTWFFFGLLAEFLGLNEADDGTRQIDEELAKEEIESLYQDFVVVDEDGRRFISGGKLLEPGMGSHLMDRFKQTRQGVAHRAKYLHDCLQFTCAMLHTGIHTDFDRDVLYSIAALGELFCTSFVTAANFGLLPNGLPHFSLPWSQNYLKPRGELEKHMLENGWCKSEIEKLRWVYQGLGTQHFLSRMRKEEPHGDHTGCSADGCVAFQLDETYRPRHATAGCACAFIGAEHVNTVQTILKTTKGYPVLRFDTVIDPGSVDGLRAELTVEEYSDEVPYVAISHVWADGMGNPKENSLPQCQIAEVASLVAELGKTVGTAVDASAPAYRFWLDTLLCPVERVGNAISLARIKDVYRNAKHVLVLDASIMRHRFESLSAAEALLRIFATSAWMRRLWTLQEGALAQTLFFQFADKAVTAQQALEQLFQQGRNDLRYMRIWIDVFTEATNLRGWFHPPFNHPSPKSHEMLISLQRSLHFRTVSVPADEPICIATLLSFSQQDQEDIIAETKRSGHAGMARVWEAVARFFFDGRLPAAMLFSADATLDIPGWRWAPRSLLGANAGAAEGVMDLNTRMMRFHLAHAGIPTGSSETAQPELLTATASDQGNSSATTPASASSDRRTTPRQFGIPTPLGLRVQMPGLILRASPLLPHLPLQPWEGTFNRPSEDYLFVREPATQQWLRLMDLHRARRGLMGELDDKQDDDDKNRRQGGASRAGSTPLPPPPPPLTESVCSGRCAILYDPDAERAGIRYCLMVQLEPGQESAAGAGMMRVRRDRMVLVDVASAGYALLAETLRGLALEVAAHEATRRLLEVGEGSGDGEEREKAVEGVRRVMKELMGRKCASDAAFARAVRDCIGFNLEQFMWAQIPVRFSHDVTAEVCEETQVWIVD
ncbi:uncharacterized protein THITE_2086288 [Thermothielavioides terrestris NRRL 8126]|uniref:Heterokaryon incompatibility domain-containing protein n=1 Tax=Thermothielavioides terrestris (strain ATCC 38088 / NRRL 8126) TaxID=578455 RepID=G2QX26_THETT|nr:uncharacterized protein THITE_2086288 [Thermothielavioides terrestris NRRL 8126]AEO64793.1 hypothetical protein THITE_2086288 [Thermothielavioides terrestris NRRL 8126]